jgi:phosphopentomutase
MEMALGNGNAKRDNIPDLLSEDNKASQHYTPVDLHSNGYDTIVGSKQSSGAYTIVRDS